MLSLYKQCQKVPKRFHVSFRSVLCNQTAGTKKICANAGSVFSMLRQQSMFAWLAGRPTKVVLRANNESTASLWMMDLKEQIATWSQRDVKSPVRRARSVDLL